MMKTGVLVPRAVQPAPVLEARRQAVSRLVIQWNDKLADSLAAVNLFLDESRDRRKAAIAKLLSEVGSCRVGTGFDFVENALRGNWTMPCDRGVMGLASADASGACADDAADRAIPPSVECCSGAAAAEGAMPGVMSVNCTRWRRPETQA